MLVCYALIKKCCCVLHVQLVKVCPVGAAVTIESMGVTPPEEVISLYTGNTVHKVANFTNFRPWIKSSGLFL